MLVLDTDHLVELDWGTPQGGFLRRKLENTRDTVATTIVSAEEQLRGWLAQIHRQRDPHEQVAAVQRFGGTGQTAGRSAAPGATKPVSGQPSSDLAGAVATAAPETTGHRFFARPLQPAP